MATPAGQIVFHGKHLDTVTGQLIEAASYAVDVPALADGVSHPGTFQVVSEYDFELLETTHNFVGIADGAHVNVKLQIQATNGRPWFIGKPIFINSISSQNAGLPRRQLVRRVIMAKTAVSVDITEAT
ncbi:MAG: hypothetical protein PSX71_14070 [bacterium]|nr:hypothetical protein [bacterium]